MERKVRVKVELPSGRLLELSLPMRTTVEQLIEGLGLNPEEFLALVNGELAPGDEELRDGCVVKLVPVIAWPWDVP